MEGGQEEGWVGHDKSTHSHLRNTAAKLFLSWPGIPGPGSNHEPLPGAQTGLHLSTLASHCPCTSQS